MILNLFRQVKFCSEFTCKPLDWNSPFSTAGPCQRHCPGRGSELRLRQQQCRSSSGTRRWSLHQTRRRQSPRGEQQQVQHLLWLYHLRRLGRTRWLFLLEMVSIPPSLFPSASFSLGPGASGPTCRNAHIVSARMWVWRQNSSPYDPEITNEPETVWKDENIWRIYKAASKGVTGVSVVLCLSKKPVRYFICNPT